MSKVVQTALVLGATSDIGRAVSRRLAAEGYGLQLAARDGEQLALEARDVEVRFQVPVSQHSFDALAAESRSGMIDGLEVLPDLAVCVLGLLGDQRESEGDLPAAEQVMAANYLGPAWLLADLANRFEARGSGTLVGVSSVAGDRGRANNYVYGSAKAGFTAFLSGLRNRLTGSGIHVVTVKPGFVRTRMTEHMSLPARLTAEADQVADAIYRAVVRRRDVIYVLPVWRLIMLIIRSLPEFIFKRTRI